MSDKANFSVTTISELRSEFVQMADLAAMHGNAERLTAAALMADLLSVAELMESAEGHANRAREIAEFCRDTVLPVIADEATFDREGFGITQQADERWGECLALLEADERYTPGRQISDHEVSEPADSVGDESLCGDTPMNSSEPETPVLDMSRILATLNDLDIEIDSAVTPASVQRQTYKASAGNPPAAPETGDSIDDPEMAAAFADDAQLCLSEMEGAVLRIDANEPLDDALRHFCRQLHTLKGASGTVGLSNLAHYLHEVESWIESGSGEQISVDHLLECVDVVREQLRRIGISDGDIAAGSQTTAPCVKNDVPRASGPSELPNSSRDVEKRAEVPATVRREITTSSANTDGEAFVRVEARQLERLMDLLAELVMLRNHRDSHIEALRQVHHELNLCAVRSRSLTASVDLPQAGVADEGEPSGITNSTVGMSGIAARKQAAQTRLLVRSLHEISRDTTELSRSLHEAFDPLARDNSAVSHLIGQFRQQLMELRRVPVGGLFQRLQRSIRDAARAEGKQVEVRVEGHGARAEREIQQRLFEPLLHLVRNGVSHGIQTPDERVAAGKSPTGCITLSATADASVLCIEVRDDGCGLNDDAIESRGRQLGLLAPGEHADISKIRQLIFHPGFSTRSSVSEIAGRGVGMDVVDNWIRRLRGRIDVESTAGNGTTFRLQIPLRSAVEHAMVVRVAGQLFALPMHAISGTSDSRNSMGQMPVAEESCVPVALGELLKLSGEDSSRSCLVRLRSTQFPDGLVVSVDAIVGVEEVVVRSLPSLLQKNGLFDGVTLSGRAEIVLLLDVNQLIELHRATVSELSNASSGESDQDARAKRIAKVAMHDRQKFDAESCRSGQKKVLLVDDSVVIRRSLSKKLSSAGLKTLEAENGLEALRLLKSHSVMAIVTDIDMPGMNGVELLQEIRRHPRLNQLPALVLSSRDDESMPEEISKLNPTAVLSKPVTDETISSIIKMCAVAKG
ncbi:MAG: response regulator [Planctomycetaceae bacterium]|nr:response regulator [Planctomycetaceae bacterium]